MGVTNIHTISQWSWFKIRFYQQVYYFASISIVFLVVYALKQQPKTKPAKSTQTTHKRAKETDAIKTVNAWCVIFGESHWWKQRNKSVHSIQYVGARCCCCFCVCTQLLISILAITKNAYEYISFDLTLEAIFFSSSDYLLSISGSTKKHNFDALCSLLNHFPFHNSVD